MNEALDAGQAKNLAVGVIIGVIVVGLILSLVISALVGRIIVLVLMIGVAIFLWTQRQAIVDDAKKCDAHLSFLGYHVSLNQDQQKLCQQQLNR